MIWPYLLGLVTLPALLALVILLGKYVGIYIFIEKEDDDNG